MEASAMSFSRIGNLSVHCDSIVPGVRGGSDQYCITKAQEEYEEALVIFKKALAAAQQPPNRNAILAVVMNKLDACLCGHIGEFD